MLVLADCRLIKLRCEYLHILVVVVACQLEVAVV